MTFIDDGDTFTYLGAREPGVRAVGWLEPPRPIPRGEVPHAFVERLRDLCHRETVRMTRGWYRCGFCAVEADDEGHEPIRVGSAEGDFSVGHAEIRVRGASGRWYASPDMVVHYVERHGYRPPDDYVDGVLSAAARPADA